ncbi:class I SAM-dependent methyltransferase [Candidatus Woesearchaeota archaeon]|nr:class I SAM-dependent methyltransferase [Candidatus Woesearchaeota archaeon]
MNRQEQYETEAAEMALDRETPLYNEQRAEAIYKLLKSINAYRILDVGCGLGKVSVYLAGKGLDVTGIDISPRLIKLAKDKAKKNKLKVRFECIRLEKIHPKEKFDAVLFAGVLEHIEHEERMMAEARRVLKNNGKILVFDMPTFEWLYTERDRRIGHTKRYTKKLLREKLEKAGYSDIKLAYYNFFCLIPTIYLLITKKKEYPYGALNPALNKLIYWWYKYVENKFIFPIGDRLIAIGTSKN